VAWIHLPQVDLGKYPFLTIEVETFSQFSDVLSVLNSMPLPCPIFVLLDNFTVEDLRSAVAQKKPQNVYLEASGGITFDRLSVYGEVGVDLISVGALTHSAAQVDLTLLIEVTS
jgi:nicotinate-nucleotide pyrophosphorylase (carboxylating)